MFVRSPFLTHSLFLPVVSCTAQRQVTVQPGPLIRTEGSHITVWCNVTGYKEGVEQDFRMVHVPLHRSRSRDPYREHVPAQLRLRLCLPSASTARRSTSTRLSGDAVLPAHQQAAGHRPGRVRVLHSQHRQPLPGLLHARTNLTGEPLT